MSFGSIHLSARCLTVAILILVASAAGVAAESLEVKADGAEYELNVAPGAREGVDLFFVSLGSVSVAVGLALDGPAGLEAEVDAALLGAASAATPSAISNLKYDPSSVLAGGAERAKINNSFVIDPSSAGGVIQTVYHIHKDACLPDSAARYVSRIKLSFARVAPTLVASGFKVRFALREYRYGGSEVATIKPSSDGKYRGEPILLMGTIQYGGEYVRVFRRQGARIRSKRVLPVVKYVSHRGQSLSLARLNGILGGGQATFELTNGGYLYGVCFDLIRRRQFANGYKL
jgi:hypothetical protein